MNKSIWHTADETPRQESRVLWKSGNIICGGRFDTHYKCFCGPASQFIDLRKVSRWCYIDDLLALKTELERTRKALDVAVDAIKRIDKTRSVANHKIGTQDKTLNSGIVFCWTTPDEIHNALEQITVLDKE